MVVHPECRLFGCSDAPCKGVSSVACCMLPLAALKHCWAVSATVITGVVVTRATLSLGKDLYSSGLGIPQFYVICSPRRIGLDIGLR